jgi:hypothetical protein
VHAAGLVDLARPEVDQGLPPPRLLGPFDPVLHGWRDRRPLLDGDETVITSNGIFHPILLAGGRAVATWGLSAGKLRLLPFAPLSASVQRAARRGRRLSRSRSANRGHRVTTLRTGLEAGTLR